MKQLTISVCIMLLSVGCSSTPCGPGTKIEDGRCVAAEPARTCGPGTEDIGGYCVVMDTVNCGDGTTEIDNVCVSLEYCDYGEVYLDGTCYALQAAFVNIPFSYGTQVEISQCFRSNFSHNGSQRFAVDFPVDEGTQIVAAKAGVVIDMREDSNTGCADSSCAGEANYIIIDHGDATLGHYWHLQQHGVFVSVGESVCQGDVIGLSGNTGWSTAPHLHFAVYDLWHESMPLYFYELQDISAGVPFYNAVIISENEQSDTCTDYIEYSSCPWDMFALRGVQLTADVPCTHAEYDKAYTLQGRLLGENEWLRISQLQVSSGIWQHQCIQADDNGNFSTKVIYDSSLYESISYFILSHAEAGCYTTQSWEASPQIYLFDE